MEKNNAFDDDDLLDDILTYKDDEKSNEKNNMTKNKEKNKKELALNININDDSNGSTSSIYSDSDSYYDVNEDEIKKDQKILHMSNTTSKLFDKTRQNKSYSNLKNYANKVKEKQNNNINSNIAVSKEYKIDEKKYDYNTFIKNKQMEKIQNSKIDINNLKMNSFLVKDPIKKVESLNYKPDNQLKENFHYPSDDEKNKINDSNELESDSDSNYYSDEDAGDESQVQLQNKNKANKDKEINKDKEKELLEARFNAISGIVRFNFIKNNHNTIILQIPNDVENIDEEVMKFINKNSEYMHIDSDKLIYNIKIDEYQEFYLNLKRTCNESKRIHRIEPIPDFIWKSTSLENSNLHLKKLKYTEEINGVKKERIIDYSDDYDINNQYIHKIDKVGKNLETLYEYQKEGVEFGINRRGRILIADEMGLGKTLQSLAIVKVYKKEWPVLIFCPTSLKYNWRNEISKFFDLGYESIQLIDSSKSKIRPKGENFIIVSYNLAAKEEFMKKINQYKFEIVIVDEVHFIKNTNTQRCRQILPYITKLKRVILLSGTPILAKPVEMFPIFNSLRPDLFNDFFNFARRYGKKHTSTNNLQELNFLLGNFTIRRLKKNVLSQLPEKSRQKIEISVDPILVKAINHLRNKNYSDYENIMLQYKRNLDPNDNTVPSLLRSNFTNEAEEKEYMKTKVLSFYNWAYIHTGESKLKGIKEYVSYLIDNKQKFLLFFHHIPIANVLEDYIKTISNNKKNFYMRIDGQTKPKDRQNYVDLFQNDNNCRIALLSITACNTGLTLTKASIVVFTQLYFTPAIMVQAEDRVHRIGQKNHCTSVYLIGKGTLDDDIFSLLNEKYRVVTQTLDNKNELIKIDVDQKFDKNKDNEINSKVFKANIIRESSKKKEITETDFRSSLKPSSSKNRFSQDSNDESNKKDNNQNRTNKKSFNPFDFTNEGIDNNPFSLLVSNNRRNNINNVQQREINKKNAIENNLSGNSKIVENKKLDLLKSVFANSNVENDTLKKRGRKDL